MVGTNPTCLPAPRASESSASSSSRVCARRGGGHARGVVLRGGPDLAQVASGDRGVEQVADPRGADRHDAAVGDGAVEGGPGQGDVGAEGLRRVGGDVLEVGPDGAEVAADDRAGQGGVALLEGVVEGRGKEWAQGAGRVGGTAAERISMASVTRVTRWLAPCARPA